MKLYLVLSSDGPVDQRKDKGTHAVDKTSFSICHRLLASLFLSTAGQLHVSRAVMGL